MCICTICSKRVGNWCSICRTLRANARHRDLRTDPFLALYYLLTLRICAEPIGVGAPLVGAQATRRIQLAGSYEGNHKGCPYNA